jgi:hypothetical protein
MSFDVETTTTAVGSPSDTPRTDAETEVTPLWLLVALSELATPPTIFAVETSARKREPLMGPQTRPPRGVEVPVS